MMFGLSSAEILTLVGIASGVGTLAFSVTPKGLTALISLSNWLGDHVFNGRVTLRLERVERNQQRFERRQQHLFKELGIKPTEEDSYEQTS